MVSGRFHRDREILPGHENWGEVLRVKALPGKAHDDLGAETVAPTQLPEDARTQMKRLLNPTQADGGLTRVIGHEHSLRKPSEPDPKGTLRHISDGLRLTLGHATEDKTDLPD